MTDPDGVVTDVVTWVWERSQNDPPLSGEPTPIVPAATSDTYTPTNADTGYFLSVKATYMDAKNDATDDPTDRMADATAAHAVLEVEDLKRKPEFPEDTATRMVAENAPSTTFVGEPLALPMDPDDLQGVNLTYTLEDSDNDSEDTAFFELFKVTDDNDDERATTQIRVKLHDMAHDWTMRLRAGTACTRWS